jgi:hypothetical protein
MNYDKKKEIVWQSGCDTSRRGAKTQRTAKTKKPSSFDARGRAGRDGAKAQNQIFSLRLCGFA